MMIIKRVLFSILMIAVVLGIGDGVVSAETTTPSTDPLPNQWQPSNPGGGGAFAAVGAGPTGIILAASDLSGAYRSLDDGQTWDVIGSERGLPVTHIASVGFDTSDGNILYLGTESGLYRSINAGASMQNVLADGYIEAISFASDDPQIGYVAYHLDGDTPDGFIYKTADRGLTWSQVSGATLPNGLRILKVVVDPTDADFVYLLAGEGRFACGAAVVYQSIDGGTTWSQLANGLGQIMDIALDPHDSDQLYLTTYGDVWDVGYDCISDDASGGYLYRGDFNGSWTWTQITNNSNLTQLNAMLWLDADSNALRLISIDYPELFESTDAGTTWTKIGDKGDWDGGWAQNLTYGGSYNGDAKTLGLSLQDADTLLWIDS